MKSFHIALKDTLIRFRDRNGLLLMLAAPRPEQAETVTGEQFLELLKFLRLHYTYVIVDTAHHLGDVTFAAFDISEAILVLMTSFTRLVVVFNFLRQAIGVQQAPPNQVLIGLALFITFFVMQPTLTELHATAIAPVMDGTLPQSEGLVRAADLMRGFISARPELWNEDIGEP